MTAATSVSLRIRGRSVRQFEPDQVLLTSKAAMAVPEWTPASRVGPGDMVGIEYGGSWPSSPAALPVPDSSALRGSEKAIRVPGEMTGDLALLLGAYFAEGHTSAKTWTVTITNSVDEVLEQVALAWDSVFGLTARIDRPVDRCPSVSVSSRRLVLFMRQLECGSRASVKRVPDAILGGTRDHALRFLQGAALDAYTTCSHAGKWAICLDTQVGIDGLQDLLTHLGIVNAQIGKFNKLNGKTYPELYAPGPAGQRLTEFVPFLEPGKEAAAERYRARVYCQRDRDVIPGITGRELYDLIPVGRCGRNGRGTGRQRFRYLNDARTLNVSRHGVQLVRDAGAALPAWLAAILESRTRFATVLDTACASSTPNSVRSCVKGQ